jgi:capsular polysaccharide transport system permease protein
MNHDPEDKLDNLTVRDETGARLRKLTSWALVPMRRAMETPLLRAKAPQIVSHVEYADIAAPLDGFSNRRLIWWSLLAVVLLPVIASGIYLFAIASDQYTAETRFAVRTLQPASAGNKSDASVPNILTMTASLGGQDADIVANYVHSRAIIDDISKHVDVRAIFQRPEADFLMRLPKNASNEDLTEYWNRMVSVFIESYSGIVTVKVRAFRREDALVLAKAILQSSEALVEDLSARVRADIVVHAEQEVQRSEALVHKALTDLQTYRNKEGLIDPVKNADATGKLLLQLMADKIQAESQLFVTQRSAGPDAPGIAPLRAKLESIKSQIADLQLQMAGSTSSTTIDIKPNLAALISRFEELDLKRQFAERLYELTQEGLTRARLIAERRAVYLAVFVPPSLPEDFSYPLRYSSLFLIFIAAFLAWCCGATIWASVLDHRL